MSNENDASWMTVDTDPEREPLHDADKSPRELLNEDMMRFEANLTNTYPNEFLNRVTEYMQMKKQILYATVIDIRDNVPREVNPFEIMYGIASNPGSSGIGIENIPSWCPGDVASFDSDGDAYCYAEHADFGEWMLIDRFKSHFDINTIFKYRNLKGIEPVVKLVEMIAENPETIYGVLLTDGAGNYLNPAHPLVAKAIKKMGIEYWFPKGYMAVVYPYAERVSHKTEAHEHFEEMSCRINHIDKMVLMLESETERIIVNDERIKMFPEFHRSAITDFARAEVEIRQKKARFESYVVPGQIIQKNGLAYPGYGMVARYEMNVSRGTATDMGIMLSANTGTAVRERDDDLDWVYDSYEAHESNLCTGSKPLYLRDSFRTLNVSNYDSAYKNIVTYLPLDAIAEEMAIQSLEIYSKGQLRWVGMEDTA